MTRQARFNALESASRRNDAARLTAEVAFMDLALPGWEAAAVGAAPERDYRYARLEFVR